MSPRPHHHLLPRDVRHPRDAATFYAIGLTAFDPETRRFAGADMPVPYEARRARLLTLLDRARALAARQRAP